MDEQKRGVAFYLRVSRDDGQEEESESITNQRELLYDYWKKHPELGGVPVELTDDGYSGTSFHRPGMCRLLDLIARGEIACVLVKDLSRFGRNYVQAGYYLEEYFPRMGVRLIAVNDRFDSAARAGANDGMELALNNLMHDLYSRDLSRKVKSARQMKMRQGEFTSPYAPYGYRKSEEERNRLEIDPEAAEVVASIFKQAGRGVGTTRIARELNARNVATPMQYKRAAGCGRDWGGEGRENFWTKDAVTRILRDERYTGRMVCGKHESDGRARAQKVSRDDWVVTPQTHEAIVSEEVFWQAQECLAVFRETGARARKGQGLGGRVFCGHCGYKMRRKNSAAPVYRCASGTVQPTAVCGGIRVEEAALETILQVVIERLAELFTQQSPEEHLHRQRMQREQALAWELEELRRQGKRYNLQKQRRYEEYRAGHLSREVYLAKKAEDAARAQQAEQRHECVEEALRAVCQAGLPSHLPMEFARALTERVTLYAADAVTLTLRCVDEFAVCGFGG